MIRVIYYLSILAIVYVLTFLTHVPDYDLWARLAVGSVFFQTGNILRHDIFSYLPTKNLWIDHEWGSGVILYILAKYFGEWGIFALKAVIILLIFMFVVKTIRLQANKNSVGIFYLIFLGFSLFPGIASLIRSQMFTYLFFALWVYGLESIRLGKNRLLWIFPSTMLLWVNVHGGFIAGIGLVLIYAFGELLNRKNPLRYFVILFLIIPVTLINPYGFKLWNYIIEASSMPRPFIPEWHAISLSGPFQIIAGIKIHILAGFMIFALLTIAAGVKLLARKEKPDWTKIILIGLLLYLGIRHQRHMVFFVLAVSGLLYNRFVNLFDPAGNFFSENLSVKFFRVWNSVKYGFGYILLAVLFVCIAPKLSYGVILNPKTYPVGSLEFIKQNNISGNLATAYDWGSYAFWKLYPQCKVLIDGRYEEVYPNDIFDAAIRFSEKKEGWPEILKKYRTDIIVLPKYKYLPEDIPKLTGWKPVYQDFVSVVLLPRDSINSFYICPDYKNPVYSKENLSKQIIVHAICINRPAIKSYDRE